MSHPASALSSPPQTLISKLNLVPPFFKNIWDLSSETDPNGHVTLKNNVAGVYIINSKLFLVFYFYLFKIAFTFGDGFHQQ